MARQAIVVSFLVGQALVVSSPLLAFENTKVLPKGVRSLTVKSVRATTESKTSADGQIEALAKPLAKDLTFKKVLQGEEGIKKTQLHAFLLNEGYQLDDALGSFTADMQAQVAVYAPILSYGLTDKLTLAVAIPYYQAKTGIAVGFRPNATAQGFVNRLHEPQYNQTAAAREAGDKINDAVGELNRKLTKNGYRSLDDWQGAGLGDATVAAKYRFVDGSVLKLATTNGVILPSGRLDNPDILTDIPFGKGTYDVFASLQADEELISGVFFNEYAKYSYSFDGRTRKRMATEDEAIEVESREIRYKLGDRFEAGASLQVEPAWGLVAGLGYVYAQKAADRYSVPDTVKDAPAVRAKFEDDTDQHTHHLEGRLGYSSVPAYRRGSLPVPFTATVEYKRHLASTNSFANDMLSVDLALFF